MKDFQQPFEAEAQGISGQRVSHYRIVRRLGAGGMGEVFLAQDTQLERPVALKVMSAELAGDPNQRKRFRTEAKAASGLSHPHICVIHEVGETEDGRPFLAMEYVEGQTLDKELQARQLKIREVIQLGIEAAEALAAAHERGLVHRDIKPGNIMLDRRAGAKVLDFGLAKWFAPDELSGAITSVAHTRTGMLIGTPQYMSPEQALGRTLDPRTDLFSLGVVLYELVAGQRPFLGKTVGETINNIVNQPPAPLGLENPVFSPALDNIILKCLEKDPEKRYASAQELAADLRKLKEDSERALAATTQERTPAPGTPASGERQPTALWKLAAKAGAGRNTALAWTLGFVVMALLAMGGRAFLHGGRSKSPVRGANTNTSATSQQQSVAVLPFVNMSADKADEYLSDGMTEELLNVLAKLPGLRVPGRSSSFTFKGQTGQDIFRKVGAQLHVSAVLEGSVRKAANRCRITVQLINVADGFHLWSETYDRDMTDILGIQSEVAQQVAAALKLQLGMADTQRLQKKPTGDMEAYTLYLQGRYAWNRRTSDAIKQAIPYFNEAIAKDPGYALAYAGLADCYAILHEYAILPSRETLPKAETNALKALQLDSTLAEPHAVLGSVKQTAWEWSDAEQEYLKAIALNPNYATTHHWYGILHQSRGDWDKALAEEKRAQEADPLSPIINATVASMLYGNGDRREAIKMLENLVELHPDFAVARNQLAWTYLQERRPAEALRQLEVVRALAGEPFGFDSLGLAYVFLGRTNAAQNVLLRLRDLQTKGRDTGVLIAWVQYGLGDIAGTLDTLERASTERAQGLEFINCEAFWKDLRPHPRVQAILRNMNLVK